MEVHHHPHVEKKGFKEYFLEFLMIFLAVTLGFFAENVREHFTEQAKGKEYVKSFVEDLATDTAQYDNIIIELSSKDSALQNLDNCFDSLNKQMKFTSGLKNIVRNSLGFTDFIYTDRTIQQIKTAGGLHLIHNKEIENQIIQYDAAVRADLIHQESMEETQRQCRNAHISAIGFKELNAMFIRNDKSQVSNQSELLIRDKGKLNSYFSTILLFKANCHGQLLHLKRLREMATNLIHFLQKHTT